MDRESLRDKMIFKHLKIGRHFEIYLYIVLDYKFIQLIESNVYL